MPKPYPREFRDDVLVVARKGESPLNQIAKDFGISEPCLADWLKKADVEDGHSPYSGRSSATFLRNHDADPDHPTRSATTVAGICGKSLRSPRTRASNSSKVESTGPRTYFGGASEANARETVSLEIRYLDAIALTDICSAP